MPRRETPTPRINPGGQKVWCARWTDKTGRKRYGAMKAHGIKGTYKTKREAQAAIDACYELDAKGPARPDTVGRFAATWAETHPRPMASTNISNMSRVRRVLDIDLEGVPLKDWRFDDLRRRHANLIRDYLLVKKGLAYTGVNAVLGALGSMVEDAIEDEVATLNPFRGMKKVKAGDQRIAKPRKPVRVLSWEEMHRFARACAVAEAGGEGMRAWRAVYAEPMVRTLSDCGLRVGELFALCWPDLDLAEGLLSVRWSESRGEIIPGTKTDHGEEGAGRVVPVASELLGMLGQLPKRLDATVWRGGARERLVFPSLLGRAWGYEGFKRQVWVPGRAASGMTAARPHEFRHSQISLLRAAGIDPADLAAASGHTLDTQAKTYTHALNRSFDAIKRAVGE